jgi:hypothetical protein
MPAITACLIVSVLRDLHRDVERGRWRAPKLSSIDCQVSEPFSPHDEGLAHDAAAADARRRPAGGPGRDTTT